MGWSATRDFRHTPGLRGVAEPESVEPEARRWRLATCVNRRLRQGRVHAGLSCRMFASLVLGINPAAAGAQGIVIGLTNASRIGEGDKRIP